MYVSLNGIKEMREIKDQLRQEMRREPCVEALTARVDHWIRLG
jgi:hypothetical protein